jgi:hypothetical protein
MIGAQMASERRWPQFSLRGMIYFVALFAMGCTALANASDLWLAITSTVTMFVLMWAIVVILFGDGPSRVFFQGFAVCGLGYLSVIYFVLSNENGMGRIGTTWVLVQLLIATNNYTFQDQFMQIGQQLWALAIGYVGGTFAFHLAQRRRKLEPTVNVAGPNSAYSPGKPPEE